MTDEWQRDLKSLRRLVPPASLRSKIEGGLGRQRISDQQERAGKRIVSALVGLLVGTAGLVLVVRAFQQTGPPPSAVAGATVANGQIAFVNDGITVVNPDGTDLRTLVRSADGVDTHPAWAPDGRRLAFLHSVGGGSPELLVLDLSTGETIDPVGSAVDDASPPTWSPDGTRIAFTSGNDLFILRADGTGLTSVTEGGYPTWSPDGTRLAFQSGPSVYVARTDGSQRELVAEGYLPAWSPSSEEIAFVDPKFQISKVGADGEGLLRLTNIPSRDTGRPAWSPDGAQIAFEALSGGDYDIYVMSKTGSDLSAVGSSPDDENVPIWSPDGARIAFIAGAAVRASPGNTDTFDVYVMNPDGTGTTQLTEGRPPAYALSWQPIISS